MLKESWLFGKLQTVGTSEAETRAENAAAKVAEGLNRLQGKKGDNEVAIKATSAAAEKAMDTNGDSRPYENVGDP